jgi:3-oxoacyl-[acyl-carrier protein] reductase
VDLVLDVNVKGMIFATKAAVRGMIRGKKGGVIINIGSLAGERMMDVPATYAAAKAAAGGFTVALAAELKRYGIRVNCVVPGLMEGGVAKQVPAEHRKHFEEHCAAGRSGKAADVAEAVCFLASDKASYIIGQKLFVDGGV